ncbi:MAG: ABC transporter permease [Hyphomicrobiaceae bacterium]
MTAIASRASAAISAFPSIWNVEGPVTGARKVVLPLLTAGLVLLAWHLATDAGLFVEAVLPPPWQVWSLFVSQHELFLQHCIKTFVECFAAFVLSALIGIGLAIAISTSRLARLTLYPNLVLFQLIPTIALAPLFVLWFGIGPQSRLIYALFIALFPIVVSASTGLMGTSPNYLRLCESLTASKWQTLFLVRFPFALPHIFAGLRVGLTLSIIGVVVGEFITSQSGIGYMISFASSSMETALALASILYLLGIGLVMFALLLIFETATGRLFSSGR